MIIQTLERWNFWSEILTYSIQSNSMMNKYLKLSWLRVRHCLDIFVMRYVAQYKNCKHKIINVGEIVPAKNH